MTVNGVQFVMPIDAFEGVETGAKGGESLPFVARCDLHQPSQRGGRRRSKSTRCRRFTGERLVLCSGLGPAEDSVMTEKRIARSTFPISRRRRCPVVTF